MSRWTTLWIGFVFAVVMIPVSLAEEVSAEPPAANSSQVDVASALKTPVAPVAEQPAGPSAAAPAASAETKTAAARPAQPAEAPAAMKVAGADPAVGADPAAAEDDPVICRTEAETGSRIRKHKICAKKSEWQAMQDASRRFKRGLDHGGAGQPGGENNRLAVQRGYGGG
jgi:hypothetical protein